MGLAVIWPNKFLSGEFRVFHGKVVIIWSPAVLAAIGMNKFCCILIQESKTWHKVLRTLY